MERKNLTFCKQQIEFVAHGHSVKEYNNFWLEYIVEVLQLNDKEISDYASSSSEYFPKRRDKFRNLLLFGTKNWAAAFWLKSLNEIFKKKVFENQWNDKFGWTGVCKASVISLQETLLLLLKGELVKMQSSKNFFCRRCIDSLERCHFGYFKI